MEKNGWFTFGVTIEFSRKFTLSSLNALLNLLSLFFIECTPFYVGAVGSYMSCTAKQVVIILI
jgi:hypothetical protein